jgi:hypothetical protein
MLTGMRRIALGLAALLVIAGCGDSDSKTSSTQSSTTTTTTTTTSMPVGPATAFPENVPTETDGECSLPRTDPARPKAGPLGPVTDGVTVREVNIVDDGPNSVIADFMVTAPPRVTAGSGERWVVVNFDGVRRVDRVVTLESPHARRLPATVCDDSAWAFALAFDREIESLKLDNEQAPRLLVFFKS